LVWIVENALAAALAANAFFMRVTAETMSAASAKGGRVDDQILRSAQNDSRRTDPFTLLRNALANLLCHSRSGGDHPNLLNRRC
jgi:hypothetical protein